MCPLLGWGAPLSYVHQLSADKYSGVLPCVPGNRGSVTLRVCRGGALGGVPGRLVGCPAVRAISFARRALVDQGGLCVSLVRVECPCSQLALVSFGRLVRNVGWGWKPLPL